MKAAYTLRGNVAIRLWYEVIVSMKLATPRFCWLNDLDKETVMADINDWIAARLSATQTKSAGA